jgi:ubiquinone/menaquinone biosynthesis C-methylase UbiE
MDHAAHVKLLSAGIPGRGGIWADLGAGSGAFTLALADLIGSEGVIHAVDRDVRALKENERQMRLRFPNVKLIVHAADFMQPLNLPPLDGVVMANSLHFHPDPLAVLRQTWSHLKPGGRLLLVEYNTDHGNTWVPYPLAYPTWAEVAARAGFVNIRQLASVPSRFLGEIYSACAARRA